MTSIDKYQNGLSGERQGPMANHLEAGQEEPFNTDYAYRQGRLHYEIIFKGHDFNYIFFFFIEPML